LRQFLNIAVGPPRANHSSGRFGAFASPYAPHRAASSVLRSRARVVFSHARTESFADPPARKMCAYL
jgi:hypothetical protein